MIAFNGWMVGTNYVVVFVILVVIYLKILRRIKKLRVNHGQLSSLKTYIMNPAHADYSRK